MAKIGPMWPWNDAEQTEFRETDRPTITQLVAMLRSGEELPPGLIPWLADLLDPDGRTPVRLVPLARKPGPPPSDAAARLTDAAARAVLEHVEQGVKQEAALREVGAASGYSRAHLMRAISRVRDMDRVADEVRRTAEANEGEDDVPSLEPDPEWDAYVAEQMRKERERKA